MVEELISTPRERRFPLRVITLNLVCVAPVQDWLKIRYRMFYNDNESSFFLRLNIKKTKRHPQFNALLTRGPKPLRTGAPKGNVTVVCICL